MNKIWEPLHGCVGIYRTEKYTVNEDSLRLVSFLKIKPDDRILDFGTGNGILCIYADAVHHDGFYWGIDVDENALVLARESAKRNLQNLVFKKLDVKDAPEYFGHGTFTRVIANPPYFTSGDPGSRALARHADSSLLLEWAHAAFLILDNGGTFSLCYPADQLAVLYRTLEQNRLKPKRTELILSGGKARLALVEAKKLGRDGLTLTVSGS